MGMELSSEGASEDARCTPIVTCIAIVCSSRRGASCIRVQVVRTSLDFLRSLVLDLFLFLVV